MIDRDGTWIEMACDECGELSGDAYDKDEFGQMTSAAKRAGWEIKPDRGGWRHVCLYCRTPSPVPPGPSLLLSSVEDSFDEEPPRLEFEPDIEALLGPSKDHDL